MQFDEAVSWRRTIKHPNTRGGQNNHHHILGNWWEATNCTLNECTHTQADFSQRAHTSTKAGQSSYLTNINQDLEIGCVIWSRSASKSNQLKHIKICARLMLLTLPLPWGVDLELGPCCCTVAACCSKWLGWVKCKAQMFLRGSIKITYNL